MIWSGPNFLGMLEGANLDVEIRADFEIAIAANARVVQSNLVDRDPEVLGDGLERIVGLYRVRGHDALRWIGWRCGACRPKDTLGLR